jgi:hypothetical protein
MKEQIIKRVPQRLVHISSENHNEEWFTPRVPGTTGPNEDEKIRRVCFATSICGAYKAIKDCCRFTDKFYVHVPYNLNDIVRRGKLCKPTPEQVYDVRETGECWVRCKVKLKCIGHIHIWCDCHDNVRFKWLAKYE